MLMGPRNVLVSRQRQLNTLKFPIQEYTNYGLLVHLKPWIGAEDTARGEFSKNPRSTLPTNTPVIHSSGFGKPVITTDTTSTSGPTLVCFTPKAQGGAYALVLYAYLSSII